MAGMDPAWLGAVLSKHSRDNSVVSVLSVQTEPAVKVGDNYSSNMIRANLKVVLGSGKITTRKVIFKKTLSDISEEFLSAVTRSFNIESLVYNVIFPQYETLISDHNVPYTKLWPDCLLTSHDLLMFEDLKSLNFNMGERKIGLNPDHARLVLMNLARLHSTSMVAISKGLVHPKILPTFTLLDGSFAEKFFRISLKTFANNIRDSWGSEWTKVEKKIRYMSDNLMSILNKLYNEPHKLSVIAHGDCWVNNMMFKYDTKGLPIELKFLDFQLAHYNSYGWDLSYFLHTSVHPEYVTSNYESFIETYVNEFSTNLIRFGHDGSQAPTVQDVKDELIRLQPYSLTSAASILPITMNTTDIEVTVDEFLIEEHPKVKALHQSNDYQKTIQAILHKFESQGMFD